MSFGVQHGYLSRLRYLNDAGTYPNSTNPIGISPSGAAISWFGAKQWTLEWALTDYTSSIIINVEDFQFRPGQGYTLPTNGVTELSGSLGSAPDPNSSIVFFGPSGFGVGFFPRHDDLYWPPMTAQAASGDGAWGCSTGVGDPGDKTGEFHMPGGKSDLFGFGTAGDAFLRITEPWT